MRSPNAQQDNAQRQSALSNPGLTSHPSVMQMASPPVELPAVTEAVEIVLETAERPASRSREQSQSSLGEPGPEITEMGPEADSHHQADVEIAVLTPIASEVREEFVHELGADHPSTDAALAELKAIDLNEGTNAEERIPTHDESPMISVKEKTESEVLPTGASQEVHQDARKDSTKELESTDGGLQAAAVQKNASDEQDAALAEGTIPADLPEGVPSSNEDIEESADEDTITTFIAELEAVAPQRPARPITMQPTSPIELEAPVQTFVLPPRSKAKMSQGKDWSSATIKDRADFFKLPNEQSAKPGMKPRDFRGTSTQDPGPVRPLKLRLAKFDGKLVPVQVHTPLKDKPDTPLRTSRLSQDVIANLIEQMSNTPPGSPGHSRAGSGASTNSAQIRTGRNPRSFGPRDSAPAPPGPGGRSMVNPDYASIGQFEGERRDSKRSSRGSKGGLKDILGGVRRDSSDSSAKSHGHSSRVQSVSGSDMLTSAGKDVLWFKEEGKTPPLGV